MRGPNTERVQQQQPHVESCRRCPAGRYNGRRPRTANFGGEPTVCSGLRARTRAGEQGLQGCGAQLGGNTESSLGGREGERGNGKGLGGACSPPS